MHFIPLLTLLIQAALSISYRKRKLLLLLFLNPVVFFAIYYTAKSTINYISKKPTLLSCSSRPQAPSFDRNRLVFVEYWDDDCDWDGLYRYTLDVNNFVTEGWIKLFGNPVNNQ
ncbi:MAG: hypothetical protein QM791_15295 [Ferruginibacter sp.]